MNYIGAYLMPHPPIILHEIGNGQEKKAQKTLDALEKVGKEIAALKPDNIILISPHGPVFSDAVIINDLEKLEGSFSEFGRSELKYSFNPDHDLNQRLVENSKFSYGRTSNAVLYPMKSMDYSRFNILPVVDHGGLVPLHFIQKHYKDFKLTLMNYGSLAPIELYQIGMVIKESIEESGKRVVVIASGDLSHRLVDSESYSFDPDGPRFDKKIMEGIKSQNFIDILSMEDKLCKNAGECGKKSIDILLGTFDKGIVNPQVYSYEGPFGIGYGVVNFNVEEGNTKSILEKLQVMRKDEVDKVRKKEDIYVKFARKVIENYIKEGNKHVNEFDDLPDEMTRDRKGTFVTIKSTKGLRGCIGTTGPTETNIANEILNNAVKACSEDPRFDSIQEEELSDIIVTVDVLGPAENVIDRMELDPMLYGVIVESGYKKGLLLPNIEGIDTVEEQIEIALNKGNISEDEDYTIKKFKVIRHH